MHSTSKNIQNDYWQLQERPIIALAPMDGVTDSPFRRLVKSINPQVVVFSEFTNALGYLRSKKLQQRLRFYADEQPYFVQLFGKEEAAFAEASKALEQEGVSGIDINMGCPSKKVVASQHGSSLMRSPDKACALVEATAKASGLPISVKTRLGWDDSCNLNDFVSSLISAGATMITIHGRTYSQKFVGAADWEPIYELKKHCSSYSNVTILGNGDVMNIDDGHQKLGNLDGFMIGRAAMGNPWVFSCKAQPSLAEMAKSILKHYHLMCAEMPPRYAMARFKKHISAYLRNISYLKSFKQYILRIDDEHEFDAALNQLVSQSLSG